MITKKYDTKISRARKMKGLTQSQVAKYCGVSVNAFQNWERELSEPVPRHNEKLKEIIGEYDKQAIK